MCSQVPFDISPRANYANYNEYGTKWLKALYRGYTDSTFSQRSEQPAFQGTQGPTIRSEVGDLIEIMFVNNLSENYATMHSMGLAYNKAHGEGADYPNNTSPGVNVVLDESSAVPPVPQHGVEPGGCVVYKWMVPENAGPYDNEPARVRTHTPTFVVSLLTWWDCRSTATIHTWLCSKTLTLGSLDPKLCMPKGK